MKQSIDINKELNERIIFERNRQLNHLFIVLQKIKTKYKNQWVLNIY